ncbi:unnamed protein product [Trichobilharzia szidati]|nr:unnamed protein product [Trichobilharzia szidati]
MIDFRRTDCSSLWSAYDPGAFKLEGLSGGDLDNNVPSVCNTLLLHALERLSVNQQPTEPYPNLFGECQLSRPAATYAYQKQQYSPSSNHVSSSGLLGSHVHTYSPVSQAQVPTVQPISRVRVTTQVNNNNYNSKLMAPSLYAIPAYSSVSSPQPYPPNPGFLNGTPPCVAPRVGYVCREPYRVSGNTESSQSSNFMWLAKALWAALAILAMKPTKPPRHQQFSTCSSLRSKKWDKDTLELHAWFNAICCQKIPLNLKKVFLAVRKRLEYDYALCAFCRNNGESPETYVTHEVKDQAGRVTCPMLRVLSCPNCHATGDNAHTISYCPYLKQSFQFL